MSRSTILEAANRPEATAVLIRNGYKVYRPEADDEGEDLVVRTPAGALIPVQLKGRVHVEQAKYAGKGIFMLFPCSPYKPDKRRDWYLIDHDALFAFMQAKHGHAAGFAAGRWSVMSPSATLKVFLEPSRLAPT